ncbi:hypothetical protein ACJJTC_011739 [Scirpophaga incertulas]
MTIQRHHQITLCITSRFNKNGSISCHNFGQNDLDKQLIIYKSRLRLKKKENKILRENLKKAYVIAKTVMANTQHTNKSLMSEISTTKSENIELQNKYKLFGEHYQKLEMKNKVLLEKIQYIDKFIELGYLELQKMKNNLIINDTPTAVKLKDIIISCGQYYADYCNEKESRLKCERKIRFLNNKSNILTSNLEAVSEELKNIRFENNKLRNENNLLKNKLIKHLDTICTTDCQKLTGHITNHSYSSTSFESEYEALNLTSHLLLVKNLLSDQNIMLQDLKIFADELKKSNLCSVSSDLVTPNVNIL